jgi:uncharacterized protein (DUF2147 family)
VDLRGFATVNTKYLPHINVFTKVDPTKADTMAQEFLSPEDRGFARTDFFVAFLVRQDKQTQLILWDPVNAIMSRAVRAGKAPAASAPAPAGGTNLAGRWQTASGNLVQVLTDNAYETYRGGKLVDKGTYLVEGDRIITRGASGKVDTETFSMPDKDTLVIHGASGSRTVLKRVIAPAPASAPAGPSAGAKAIVGSWGSADGKVVIVLTETTYKNVVNGRETETGTYKVEGNCITTTSSAGKTETQTFALAGDALTITGRDGKPSVFQRR